LRPDIQRILVLDGPAVLGSARYTELDERYSFAVIVAALRQAVDSGILGVDDPETVTRLLMGALTRGAMLIAFVTQSGRHAAHRFAIDARVAGRAATVPVTALVAQARGDESAYDDYPLGTWAGIAHRRAVHFGG
jgi:hypothetical protein